MIIEAQSGVTQPPKRVIKRRRYPFDELEIGYMFFAPGAKINSMTSYASTQGRRLNMKFSTRAMTCLERMEGWIPCNPDAEGAVAGVGVWRTG